jgi:branched-chain amino acid transport system substrate-binding protein
MAGLLVMAACGDDDDSDSASSTTADATSSTTAPDGVAAEGEPVKIGVVVTEGPTLSLKGERIGAEIAAAYANAELGGIAGRPIELVSCAPVGTPESTRSCANEMIDAGVSAVFSQDGNRAEIVTPVTDAGIPYFSSLLSDPAEFGTDLAFGLTSGVIGTYPAQADYAAEQGWTDYTMFITEVPSLRAVIDGFTAPAFEAAGVNLHVVGIPADNADFTPFAAEGFSPDPSGFSVVGVPAFCAGMLRAIEAGGYEAQHVVGGPCISDEFYDAMGDDALNGALVMSTIYDGEETEEGQLFVRVLANYGPADADPDDRSIGNGYSAMLTFVRLVNDGGIVADDTSPEAVVEALRAAKDVPLALGEGVKVTCDGTAVENLPGFCSNAVFFQEIISKDEWELVTTTGI